MDDLSTNVKQMGGYHFIFKEVLPKSLFIGYCRFSSHTVALLAASPCKNPRHTANDRNLAAPTPLTGGATPSKPSRASSNLDTRAEIRVSNYTSPTEGRSGGEPTHQH